MASDKAGKHLLLALVQLRITKNKEENLAQAKSLIIEAAKHGAQLVSLPECFNSPYGTQHFVEYSETIPGNTTNLLSQLAKDLKIHLVGGSIPESRDGKFYNTSVVFGADGSIIGKYSKVHLADVALPGTAKFTESSVLTPGDKLTTFQAGPCKVGIGICYDLRFPELANSYEKQGCQLLLFPEVFHEISGPAHLHQLVTARALDNQLFVAACSPARNKDLSYIPWGHSIVVDPWGKELAKADETEQIIYASLDVDYVEAVRNYLPTRYQKRKDVYDL
eukprot:Seg3796.2 transcript_id=Seg3796.2/GoldUCD/mRNA.D3Y31 product="Omega-amidase NIT2" protein_id=Seg3796.2/GoldUCD/D3Y31